MVTSQTCSFILLPGFIIQLAAGCNHIILFNRCVYMSSTSWYTNEKKNQIDFYCVSVLPFSHGGRLFLFKHKLKVHDVCCELSNLLLICWSQCVPLRDLPATGVLWCALFSSSLMTTIYLVVSVFSSTSVGAYTPSYTCTGSTSYDL